MVAQTASIDSQPGDSQHDADALFYRGVLHELIDMGAGLARLLHQQAVDAAAVGEPVDVTLAFDRVARAVRRTVTLARKVAEPVQAAGAGQGKLGRVLARKRILREVEDAIQRGSHGADAEALHAELLDRLDGADLDDDIENRPVAEIIAEICRDLGLAAVGGTQPWKRRTPEDIAALCGRAARAMPVAGTAGPVVAGLSRAGPVAVPGGSDPGTAVGPGATVLRYSGPGWDP